MEETLKFIFSSIWVYLGTVVLIYSLGHALAFPFYWYYKLKQNKLTKSIWFNDN